MNSPRDKIPSRHLSAKDQDEIIISEAEQQERDAKTPEERAKTEALLTQLHKKAKWRFIRELPPLFRLYQHEDGRWLADLSSELAAKALALRAKTHNDKEAEVIAKTMNTLAAAASASPGTLIADLFGKDVLQTLHDGLIPRLHAITLATTPESRMRLGGKLKKDLAHAIDQHVKPEGLKPRANAILVPSKSVDGQTTDILIEQAAIDGARFLAQQFQALPTKLAVRQWIEKHYPETVHLSETKWTSLWRNAGLESLPGASAWSKR